MITFKQFITEARMAPLYRAIPLELLNYAAKDNALKAYTFHSPIEYSKQRLAKAVVSLTRDFKFAKRWGSRTIQQDHYKSKCFVVLELDQEKLAQNYKMIAYNHFAKKEYQGIKGRARYPQDVIQDMHGVNFPVNQYEENVIGSINNLNRYLVKIHYSENITSENLDKLNDYANQLRVPLSSDKMDRTKV